MLTTDEIAFPVRDDSSSSMDPNRDLHGIQKVLNTTLIILLIYSEYNLIEWLLLDNPLFKVESEAPMVASD